MRTKLLWRTFSVLLIAFMAFTVLPMGSEPARADAQNTQGGMREPTTENIIYTITITNAVITPVIGKKAGECLGYELPDDALYSGVTHFWFCDSDGEAMLYSSVFEEGKEYSLAWGFVTTEGYFFSRHIRITINGSSDIVDTDNTMMPAAALWVWTLPMDSVAEPEFEVGDVNMDGNINTGDAVILLCQSVGLVEFTAEQEILADFNGDGKINTGDAVSVLKYCVGL